MKLKSIFSCLMLMAAAVAQAQSLFVKQSDGIIQEYAIDSVEDVFFGETSERAKERSITYVANNGTDNHVVKFYPFAQIAAIEHPADLSFLNASGDSFIGWNTKPDGSGVSLSGSNERFCAVMNITLYAQWASNAEDARKGAE